MPDELLQRLRRFREDAFAQYRAQFRALVEGSKRGGACPALLRNAGWRLADELSKSA